MEEDEEFFIGDELLEEASNFAFVYGDQSEESTKKFLDRVPLRVIIAVLQKFGHMTVLVHPLAICLVRIFKTRYGLSLLPDYMSYVPVGLAANSQLVKFAACKIVSCLLKNPDQTIDSPINLMLEHYVYPHLLECLIKGDDEVASAAMEAIKNLAGYAQGMELIFPTIASHPTHLRNVAAESTSLVRIRVLALIVELFSVSPSVASAVYNSNLLSLLEAEVSNADDTLAITSILELLEELAEVRHGAEFLLRTTLLQLLTSLICNPLRESMLRANAMKIVGRLMSTEKLFSFVDEASVRTVILAIDERLEELDNYEASVRTVIPAIDERLEGLESLEADEFVSAMEAIGQIGMTIEGASLLLSGSPPAARHVVYAAFDRIGQEKQLAALDALGKIAGETRPESNRMLNANAEESLRCLICQTASRLFKFSPAGLLLSILEMESGVRFAGYRLIIGLAARLWCLMGICYRKGIIDMVTDTYAETSTIGMEARHKCCEAILNSLLSYPSLQDVPALARVTEKLDKAVKKANVLQENFQKLNLYGDNS